MEITRIKISDIKEAEFNYNIHPNNQIKQLVESLSEFGQFKNVVVWKNKCIAGNGLLSAAKKIGWKYINAIVLDELSESKAKKLCISDNATPYLSIPDPDKLKLLLQSMDNNIESIPGVDEKWIENCGLSLETLLNDNSQSNDIPSTELINDPKTKLGDIYSMGKHKLLCGDSSKLDNIKRLIGNEKMDIVLTDPPYDIEIDNSILDGCIGSGNIFIFQNDRETIKYLKKSLFEFVKFFVFHHGGVAIPQEGGKESFLRHILISHEKKGNALKLQTKNGLSSVINSNYRHKKEVHKHLKPTEHLMKIIEGYSTLGQNVIDFFLGSGNTLLAAEKTDRICYGFEIDPLYCDIIVDRWQNLTNNKAILESEKWS